MCKILFVFIILSLVSASRDLECTSASDGKREDGAECVSSREPYSPGLVSNVTGEPRELPARTRARRQVTRVPKSYSCILPAYPLQGTYVVFGAPNAAPGQPFDSFKLTVGCRRGYGFVENGAGGTAPQIVYCLTGDWSHDMPKCVRFCRLTPDPSVNYMCEVPGAGFGVCEEYVPPGTRVRPVCNTPLYYSSDLRYMNCVNGYWDHVAKCMAECGRVTPVADQLVVGGERAKRGELPWHAGIYTKKSKPFMHICGGSLVSNNAVISAAHCFWSPSTKLLPSSDYAVAIGKIHRSWDNVDDFSAQKSDIKEIRITELFQGEAANLQEDIAVLILTTPIIYLTYVRPVCLNYDLDFEKRQLRHGNLGKVAGWGLTAANGKASQVLKTVNMPFIENKLCIDTLPQSFREYITSDKLCAGYTNGTALCKGDSGGGLAFPALDFGIDRYYLRGVVSAVPPDEDKLCNDYTYTTFTRISKHDEFIQESLAASMNKSCPLNVFQCDDGACRDQGVDCNGRRDCEDGSDEADELCVPQLPVSTHTKAPHCELPSPEHATYDLTPSGKLVPNDLILLTIICERGYHIENASDSKVTETIYCISGVWSKMASKCVLSGECKLNPDSSIRYMCSDPTTTSLKECNELVAPGTTVVPVCKNPGFFTQTGESMTCSNGTWDYIANCDTECGRTTSDEEQVMENKIGVREARRGDLPWLVAIYIRYNKTEQHCSGSIISHKVAVTSKHCLNTYRFYQYIVIANFDDNWDRERNIKWAYLSPSSTDSYGIAIMVMDQPFHFNKYVKPICLDLTYDTTKLPREHTGVTNVWMSELEDMKNGSQLHVVNYETITNSDCGFKLLWFETKPRTMLSLKFHNMCGTYSFDRKRYYNMTGFGGSPLVTYPQNITDVQRYYLRGVTSHLLLPCQIDGSPVEQKILSVQSFSFIKGKIANCTETNDAFIIGNLLFDNDIEFLKKIL